MAEDSNDTNEMLITLTADIVAAQDQQARARAGLAHVIGHRAPQSRSRAARFR